MTFRECDRISDVNQILRTLLIGTITVTTLVAQGPPSGQSTGQDWLKWSQEMRLGFAVGFNAGYGAATIDAGVRHPPRYVVRQLRCMSQMTYGQDVAIVDKYVADHPEKWDNVVHSLFAEAITNACAARDLP
jgi:hypothetical protein